LQLTIDEKGLFIRASLANTTSGKDLYELIRRGDVDKQSFAMLVSGESYNRATRTRHVEKIKRLADVSAVDMAAYDQTSISARSYFDSQIEIENRVKTELEAQRKRLIIATYL
jgi:HK97 family phage prohead protease